MSGDLLAKDERFGPGFNQISDPPERLYRYRPFRESEYVKKELEELEKSCRVFLSKPENLNDPAECQPLVAALTRSNACDLIMELKRFDGCKEVDFQKLEIEGHLAFCSETAFQAWAVDYINVLMENAKKLVRIACFTKKADSTSMWDRYADNYKGVCLEFEINKECQSDIAKITFYNSERMLKEVSYEAERPILSPKLIIIAALANYSLPIKILLAQPAVSEIFCKSYFVKSKDWETEQEIRLVTQSGKQYLPIDPYRVSSIILGPKFDERCLKELDEWAKKTKVPLLRSRFSKSYGVEIIRSQQW